MPHATFFTPRFMPRQRDGDAGGNRLQIEPQRQAERASRRCAGTSRAAWPRRGSRAPRARARRRSPQPDITRVSPRQTALAASRLASCDADLDALFRRQRDRGSCARPAGVKASGTYMTSPPAAGRARCPCDRSAGRRARARSSPGRTRPRPRCRAAASERGPYPIQNRLRVRSQTQSPAPSSTTPSGSLPHRIDQAARLQRPERRLEMRLLALALRMAEARQQHLAVHHHRRVGGEDQIRTPDAGGTSSIAAPRSVSRR